MTRYFLLFSCLLWLTSCSSGWDAEPISRWRGADQSPGQLDFNWQLSGDKRVAPLQVFDNGRQTWLQFAAGQPVPALFAATTQGELPLPFRRHEPYVVVDAKWPTLVMRGGRLWAKARHLKTLTADAIEPESAPDNPGRLSASTVQAESASLQTQGPSVGAPRTGASSEHFRIDPADGTMRQVLARWAQVSGWTFQTHHWAVDADIPLAGSADFAGDFKSAVRELLAATELADRPVQPCFYANRVLRVVPWTQPCDRSIVSGRTS